MSETTMSNPTAAPVLSVIIPAFNESESLVDTVAVIIKALDHPETAQLVLVNDGSSDTTISVMRSIETDCPAQVLIVDRSTNGGLGRALASGFAVATGDVLTWIPGDGEYELDEVLVGVPMLTTADIVLVRRNSRGQLGRNLLSTAMYALIKVLFGFNASGYCGIFVVDRRQWSELAVQSEDVFFTLEVALRARHRRWRIEFIVAEWRPRRAGRSKVFNVRTVLRNVGELFTFRWRLWRGH